MHPRFGNLVQAVEQAVNQRNWYAALALALALPDIMGWLETGQPGSRARYVDWFNQNLRDTYTSQIGPDRETVEFLNGDDCYALRCTFLHNGADDITEQRARRALERFCFNEPPATGGMHCNLKNNIVLQLQVDEFCHDVCGAARGWWDKTASQSEEILERVSRLMEIHRPFESF